MKLLFPLKTNDDNDYILIHYFSKKNFKKVKNEACAKSKGLNSEVNK